MPRYQGMEDFLATCEEEMHRSFHEGEDAIVTFSQVGERTFQRNFLDSVHKILRSWKSYDYESHTLQFTMAESPEHAHAATTFSDMVARWRPQSTRRVLLSSGACPFETSQETRTGKPKARKPDGSWHPRTQFPGPPSVVLECAKSESRRELMTSVKFWLHEARSQGLEVEVVVTIQVKPLSVDLEKWKFDRKRDYRCEGKMTVKRANLTSTSDSLQVSGASFQLTFQELTRMKPQRNHDCSNLCINRRDAGSIAQAIWIL
ncbi:hypothetical protein N7462_004662 [Penicillium macrosclerotiorum]|uniref:uncharacterized protein n=1 Tax=Penicillium macrosclerotiorum TaxID=303699 RepID=UPI002548E143|nr:uncharacterized protein N7462_004662 [Penicillium macrosclerotiorum]KAJ5690270.1 hypothetical protein N7462_004662 [Penicillium macrosclerotiorum]